MKVGIFSTELSKTSLKATIPSLSELIFFALRLFDGKKLELDMFCKHPVLKNNAQAVKPTKKFLRLKNDMQYSLINLFQFSSVLFRKFDISFHLIVICGFSSLKYFTVNCFFSSSSSPRINAISAPDLSAFLN